MHLPENTRNAAQEARQVADDEVKRVADVPSVRGGETWGSATGHSGTHAAWGVSGVILAGFLLGAFGFTIGPRVLLWIGVGIIVVAGAYGLITHAWSDYRPNGESDEKRQKAQQAEARENDATRRSP